MFNYTIAFTCNEAIFNDACYRLEKQFPNIVIKEEMKDALEGDTIKRYSLGGKNITIYDDSLVDAVYIESDINLDDIFRDLVVHSYIT